MIVYQPNSVVSHYNVTAIGEVASRLVMDTLLVDKRVFGPDHRTVLVPLVIHREIQI